MPRARLTTGAIIDDFTVGKRVHNGGMAILYEVTHPELTLPMLMKVPLLFEGEDAEAIVGFEMEQMILPRLRGPHVPRFIALGDFSREPYIVMERIAAQSLLQKRTGLPLPPEEVAQLGAKIALALADLHRQHVVHNDIKPSNILFRESGEAVLVDFGLSRHDQLPDLMEEEFHIPIGTSPYMSPEQIRRNRGEPRSDIFSLGVLLYFYATGTRPFGEPKGQKAVNRRLWSDPVPPRKLNPAIPPWLQEVILRCMEVDPAKRHPSAAQLALDLQYPEQIKLTARADKLSRDPFMVRWRRRMSAKAGSAHRGPGAVAQVSTAPIIAAAIDLNVGHEPLDQAMRETIGRFVAMNANARLALLNVQKIPRLALDSTLDADGQNKHVKRLVALKHWARPLGLGEGRMTLHVLEAMDPAAALIEYARVNRVDHLVLGARGASTLRRYLGSVSAQVVAEAPCSVTVVRTQGLAAIEGVKVEAAGADGE